MATDAHAVAVPAAMGGTGEDPAGRVAELFDAHHQRLFRLARRLVRRPDDPADLVQETFLRVARAPERVPSGMPNEEAWLVRVLINVCRDNWRFTCAPSPTGM
jgi:DNA-directed RNA polymerase specialized sigma24 family protein